MPPKKDSAAADNGITGYDLKETKLLAAAFLSSIGPDKYDYTRFAQLAGFTEGTLKKFWPPVKRKAIENHESFGKFLTGSADAAATASKANGEKKRKAVKDDADAELEADAVDTSDSKPANKKPKKAPAKSKARGKKIQTDDADEEMVKDEEDSADGGDGMEEA